MTFSQIMLFTADLLICHSMKCAGGINSNDGSVPLIVPVAFPVVSHHVQYQAIPRVECSLL